MRPFVFLSAPSQAPHTCADSQYEKPVSECVPLKGVRAYRRKASRANIYIYIYIKGGSEVRSIGKCSCLQLPTFPLFAKALSQKHIDEKPKKKKRNNRKKTSVRHVKVRWQRRSNLCWGNTQETWVDALLNKTKRIITDTLQIFLSFFQLITDSYEAAMT